MISTRCRVRGRNSFVVYYAYYFVIVNAFRCQFSYNYVFFPSLQVTDVDDIQDILYKLDDVASHSATNLYKDYLHFVNSQRGKITQKIVQLERKIGGCLQYITYVFFLKQVAHKIGTYMCDIITFYMYMKKYIFKKSMYFCFAHLTQFFFFARVLMHSYTIYI